MKFRHLHPPGQGTNRTKRRNQMRRTKLRLLRDAENLQNFEEAKERAARREQGEDVDDSADEDTSALWIEDRTPMYTIKGVGLTAVQSSNDASSSESSMPPGAGSFGMVEPELVLEQVIASAEGETSKGKKRKRDDEPAESTKEALPRQPGPRLDDMQPGQAPYGGDVPAGVLIRHIDCEAYYDEEIAKLEAEALEGSANDHQGAEADDARKQGKASRRNRQHRARAQHANDENDGEEDAFELDYGSPDRSKAGPDDKTGPRKRIRMEELEEVSLSDLARSPVLLQPSASSEPSSRVHSQAPAEADTPSNWTHIGTFAGITFDKPTYPADGPIDPNVTWQRIFDGVKPSRIAAAGMVLAEVAEWSSLKAGMGLLWSGLALDPVRMCPAEKRFVGVVVSADSLEDDYANVQVDAMGPLEEEADKDWADYEVERISWIEQNRPPTIHMVY